MHICKAALIALTIFSVAYSNCVLSVDSNEIMNRIINNWELKNISGGFGGGTFYNSYSYKLTFEFDSNKSIFKEYKNDSLMNTDYVSTKRVVSAGDTCWKIVINLNYLGLWGAQKDEGFYVRFYDDSIMYLDEGCCDRYSFRFELLKSTSIIQKIPSISINNNNVSKKTTYFNVSGRKVNCINNNLSTGIYFKFVKANNQMTLKRIFKIP